jgi:protoporphyrinogen oxidase
VNGLPNLFLAGNYFDGVGIPDAIRRARCVALTISGN